MYRWLAKASLAAACAVGVALILVMHYSRLAQPALLSLSGPPDYQHPLPLRRWDPTCRLRGWRTLAQAVDCIRTDLERQGIIPILAGSAWTIPGELAFYCAGHPTVYCLGPAFADRHSQYDLWRPNPLSDPIAFRGRTFIVVASHWPAAVTAMFDRVDKPILVAHRERGIPVAQWTVAVCRGFRGLPENGRQGIDY
jgi:hypothetical protein